MFQIISNVYTDLNQAPVTVTVNGSPARGGQTSSLTFILYIINPCPYANINLVTPGQAQSFVLSSTPRSVTLPTFSSNLTTGVCGSWNYSMTIFTNSNGTTYDSVTANSMNPFVWDSTFGSLNLQAQYIRYSYVSPYTVVVRAYQGTQSTQVTVWTSFVVTILSSGCIVF